MFPDDHYIDGSPWLDVKDPSGRLFEFAPGTLNIALRSAVVEQPGNLKLLVCAGSSKHWALIIRVVCEKGDLKYHGYSYHNTGWADVVLPEMQPGWLVGVAMVRLD